MEWVWHNGEWCYIKLDPPGHYSIGISALGNFSKDQFLELCFMCEQLQAIANGWA